MDAIIQRTPFMLIGLGRDSRYQFISRAYAEVTGRRPEAVVGKTLREVIGEENFQAICAHMSKEYCAANVSSSKGRLVFPGWEVGLWTSSIPLIWMIPDK